MNMEINELELADYDIIENVKAAFYRLWKLKVVVLLTTLIGFLVFFVFISIVGNHTEYRSHAAVYSAVYGSFEESTDGVTVMNKYASLLGTSRVCSRAAETLADPELTASVLSGMVQRGEIYLAGASSNSREFGYRLTLVTVSENPHRIMDISNAMAQAFADEINDLLGFSSVQVLDAATTYSSYDSINEKLYLLLFGGAGFFLAVVIILVKEFFSSKVYTVGQCEKNRDYVFGLIPYSTKK